MNINKFEAVGIGVSIATMAVALFLLRVDSSTFIGSEDTPEDQRASVIVSADDPNQDAALADAIIDASEDGRIERLIIDDIVIGTGDPVEEGDTVTVHYIGTLENGQQFDNSYLKREPFTFTIGEGKVIRGWEEGVLGMKTGGQRVLVVPPELAYGREGYGPIPGGATLVFAVELLEVK